MDNITKEEILVLLQAKNRLDVLFYEIIDKDIPNTDYVRIVRALRRASQEIYSVEMDYLVATGQVAI